MIAEHIKKEGHGSDCLPRVMFMSRAENSTEVHEYIWEFFSGERDKNIFTKWTFNFAD